MIADGLVADGPEEIRKAVREEIKYGSDWIKLLVTGAYQSVGDDPRNVAFSPEELAPPCRRGRTGTMCRSPRTHTPRTASSRPSPPACAPSSMARSSMTKASR